MKKTIAKRAKECCKKGKGVLQNATPFTVDLHKCSAPILFLFQATSLVLLVHHQQKRFIGRVETGFDFLGYYFLPGRKLRPSPESLRRLRERARRLYEREADINQLWQYVQRWQRWIFGGLDKLVSKQGGAKRTMRYILSYLRIFRALI